MLKDKNLGGEIIFPSYVPQAGLKMCVEPTVKLRAHNAKIKEFIAETIKQDPCTNEIDGPTLFDDSDPTAPKWVYMWQQIKAQRALFKNQLKTMSERNQSLASINDAKQRIQIQIRQAHLETLVMGKLKYKVKAQYMIPHQMLIAKQTTTDEPKTDTLKLGALK